MTARDLVYANPHFVFLLPAALLLFLLYAYLYKRRKNVQTELGAVLFPRNRSRYWLKAGALTVAWIAAVLALMGPQGNPHYPESHKPVERKSDARRIAHDVIFLLDTSASMSVKDTATGESRLELAKEIIEETIRLFHGENVALYVFTSQGGKYVPSTLDYLFARMMLKHAGINEGDVAGTDLYEGLSAVSEEERVLAPDKARTLVVLSDGGDHRIEDAEGAKKQEEMTALLQVVKGLNQVGFHIYTVGLGSINGGTVPNVLYKGRPVNSKLEEPLLQQIAQAGQGEYFSANALSPLYIAKHLYASIEKRNGYEQVRQQDNNPSDLIYDQYFQYPLALAVFLLLAVLIAPDAKRALLLAGMILPCLAEAQDDLREAFIYDEAGDYVHARELLEGRLKEEKEPWKQELLKYDIATTYLKEGKWNEAVHYYDALLYGNNPYPLIIKRTEHNLAIARWREALQLLSKEPLTEDEHNKVVFLIREVFRDIEMANDADCILRRVEGDKTCTVPEDLEMVRRSAQKRLAEVLIQKRQQRIDSAAPEDVVIYILFGIGKQLVELEGIDKIPDPVIKKQYTERESIEAQTWFPLWQSQEPLIHSETFTRAFGTYQKAVQQLKEGEVREAKESLHTVNVDLGLLLKQLFDNDPVPEILERLMAAYQIVLAEKPIQKGSLTALEGQQRAYIDLLNRMQGKVDLNEAELILSQALQGNDPALAFVTLSAAQQQVQLAKWRHEDHHRQPDVAILVERALILERRTLESTRLLHNIPHTDEQKALELLLKVQRQVVEVADQFEPAVYEEQKKGFNAGGKLFCQYRPWNEAVPLLAEGTAAANRAEQEIAAGSGHLGRAIVFQETAVDRWQKALDQLQQPRTGETCTGQEPSGGGEGEKEEEAAGGAEQEPKPQPASYDQVLRLLQQMEQDDRQEKSSLPIIQGDKPW